MPQGLSLLDPVQPDGVWHLRGVVENHQVKAPLGRLHWQIGPHFFGIDDSYGQPILARAYYDPYQDDDPRARGDVDFLGYQQFVQVLFDGVPVPPDSYGGQFADRGPYAAADLSFVDYMGPADAVASAHATRQPFYALTGALPVPVASARDFGTYPRRNGVLLFPSAPATPNQARCASLVSAVSPGLLTAGDLRDLLAPIAPYRSLRPTAADVALRGVFDIALSELVPKGQSGQRYRDLAGEVVGPYLLVRQGAQCFCVAPDPAGTRIEIYRLDPADVESARQSAVLRGMWKMAELVPLGDGVDSRRVVADLDNSVLPELGPMWTPRSPAAGGVTIAPLEFGPTDLAVEWRYTTYLFAARSHPPGSAGNPLGELIGLHGFTWSILQSFDIFANELVATSVRAPRLLTEFPALPALRHYHEQIARWSTDPSAVPGIGVDAFTAAGVTPLDFGAGRKLTALDERAAG
ncbi:hypothetical protein [Pseudofrankia inefficax]|uniref:Uncharacterized protein n=1 Tax=Pseudofrankia inefficax (strain DSM 45817 / CECT 9037 / DDB 130130 / EuI1c) TaxID=298654 RepID=E3J9M6_PSEI1|nr:hypothetical protein [Pseudofrankia inefficax]ADP84529.1 hypothetical protein FraEuI1c_6553 [Pseudofrankia inefficax]